jgi:glycosyltransferase involved in cell wall biosynthesis
MKILQIIPAFAPKFGGPVTSVFSLSKEFVKQGNEVTVLTSDFDYDETYAHQLEDYGVEIIPFHTMVNFGLFIYTPSMKKWLKDNVFRYDIIHMHNFRAYQNSLVIKYAKHYNIPTILQARGSVLPFFQKTLLKKIYDIVWGFYILKNTSKVIALCDTEAQQYQKMGVSLQKIEIIPNGIDLTQFSDLPLKGSFRSKYNISENEKIILFLGRIHKIKGIDLLIEAYSKVLEEFPNVRLVIAGPDDHYFSTLQKQIINSNITNLPLFTGPLYGKEKLSAYIDADVYVLPSRYETFPNTVLEAWACGRPVIVTKGCLIADIIERAGYVSEFEVNQLKNLIIKSLRDDFENKKFGEIGQKLVQNEFDSLSVTKKMISFYSKTIEETE